MLLEKYKEFTTSLPKSLFVPSAASKFIESREAYQFYWLLKFAKRYFVYWVIGRVFGLVSEREEIASEKNILWINFSAPSLGDSLMDLSAQFCWWIENWTYSPAKQIQNSIRMINGLLTCLIVPKR